jgi:penicillin-binding protein 1A
MRNVTGGLLPAAIWKDVMVVAEKGLPAKPLAKSAPQEPEYYDEDSPYAGSDAAPGYRGDDESWSGRSNGGARAENRGRSFLDWLFGPDEDEPPPPRPRRDRGHHSWFDDEPPVGDDE